MRPLCDIDDEALLCQRQPGLAGAAFGAFYERHERTILAYFMRRVREAELAADLAAETFSHALEGRERFVDGGSGSGVRWLFGIAGHVYSREVRQAAAGRRRNQRLQNERTVLSEDSRAAIDLLEQESVLEDALALLPPGQAHAVRAYILEDQSYEQIAERSGCTPVTARKRVSRGLAAVRNALEVTR